MKNQLKSLLFTFLFALTFQLSAQVIRNPDGTVVNWKQWQTDQSYLLTAIALNSGGFTFIDTIVAGSNVTVDFTNRHAPVINSTGGGESSYIATNGNVIVNDTLKWGGSLTQNTVINISDTNVYLQIGQDGNALNINKPLPIEFSGLAKEFTGFDFTDTIAGIKSFVGILNDVTIPDLAFYNETLVGTFTFSGDFLTGNYSFYVNATRLGTVKEVVNLEISYISGDISNVVTTSLTNSEYWIRVNDYELTLNSYGIELTDGINTLNITAESLLVPPPPPTGSYVLTSIEGVVSWVIAP